MPIHFDDQQAVFSGIVSVEEAESLLEWLQAHPGAPLDLAACTHLHAASLQVLMAAKAHVAAWPQEADLAAWLKTTLQEGEKQ